MFKTFAESKKIKVSISDKNNKTDLIIRSRIERNFSWLSGSRIFDIIRDRTYKVILGNVFLSNILIMLNRFITS